MSKETNTPRTAAGLTEEQHQAILDLALPTASTEGPNAWTQDRINERVRFARELERIAGPAIEAEAAAPPPESGWPFHTNEELEALTPRKPAEPLDMERLALAISNVSGDGRVLDVDREETRKVAAEYNRLAAARPEADHD